MLPLFYESAGFIDVRAQSVVLRGGRELVHCIMRRKSQARHFNSVETLDSARTTSEKPHNSTKTQVTQIPMLPIRIMVSWKFFCIKSHFSQNSHFENIIFDKIHIFKVSFFTKFTFWKYHICQNSHFQSLIFDKNLILKVSFFTKFTFWKYHFRQNSRSQSVLFQKIRQIEGSKKILHISKDKLCQKNSWNDFIRDFWLQLIWRILFHNFQLWILSNCLTPYNLTNFFDRLDSGFLTCFFESIFEILIRTYQKGTIHCCQLQFAIWLLLIWREK